MNIARQQRYRAVCVHMSILAMNLADATMGNFRGKSTHVNMEKLIEVIEMIVTEVVLAVCVAILFAVFVKQCARIERCEDNMGMSEAEIQELRRRCDAYKELIEALSKSVRELNGVVEAAVKSKEPTSDNKPDEKTYWLDDILDKIRKRKEKPIDATEKHDTEALVLGWNVDEIDEPELVSVEEFKKNIVDICVNGTYEQKQDLIGAMAYQNYLSSQTQQCNYQTLRGDLLSQTQQCILPWRQTPSGAILPLWFINKRLEDM